MNTSRSDKDVIRAMSFALDSVVSKVTIEACGVGHRITFSRRPGRAGPQALPAPTPSITASPSKIAPVSKLNLSAAEGQVIKIIEDFGWLTPISP